MAQGMVVKGKTASGETVAIKVANDGTLEVSGGGSSASVIYKKLIDDSTPNVTYVGQAVPGTATSAASWQIKKIDETSGVAITWADSGDFTQIWDNRAGLVYA